MNIITRFAPSPSGYLHIGNIRIALYSWIFSKKNNGKFLLRIEDTNKLKSEKKFIKNIIKDIKWIGIKWDSKIVIQSNKLNYYNKIINNMVESNIAYPCFCTKERINYIKKIQLEKRIKPKYDNFCRYNNFSLNDLKYKNHVIRFKNPNNTFTSFKDLIHGNIKFNNNELDDFIIRRENKFPTYNFCVVIDDNDYKITHIIRGDDHISNTPKQINLLNSINAKIPKYIHIPIILDENKNKISKSKNFLSLKNLKNEGIISYSIRHYLFSIGNYNFDKFEKNILYKKDIIENFSIKKINKSNIIFNKKKLLWINKNYLNKLSNIKICKIFKKYINQNNIYIKKRSSKNINNIIFFLKNRSNTFKKIIYDHLFLFNKIIINKKYLINIEEKYKNFVLKIIKKINLIKIWNIKNIILCLNEEINLNINKKKIYKIITILLSGKDKNIEVSVIIYLLGKKVSIIRLKKLFYSDLYV